MLGESADAQLDPRQIQAFARTQLASHSHSAARVDALHPLNPQLHQSVVQKKLVAGLDHARQRLKSHRHPLRVADHLFSGQSKAVARAQKDRLRGDSTQSHLGSGQVGHYRHATACRRFRRADPVDARSVGGKITVRKIQPGHVQSSAHEPLQHFGRIAGRTNGGDNSGFMIG